jgi:hypothetical protein
MSNQFYNANDNPKYQTGRFTNMSQYADQNAAVNLGNGQGSMTEKITDKVKNNPKTEAV